MKDNRQKIKIGKEINILSGYPFNSKFFNNEKKGITAYNSNIGIY